MSVSIYHKIIMASRIDVGVFDMSKLPVNWSKVNEDSVDRAASELDTSLQAQIAQLEQLVKENNIPNASIHADIKHGNSPSTH